MSYISSERKKMLFESWLNEEPDSLLWLQTKKLPEVYLSFLSKDQYNKEVNLFSFTSLSKEHLFSLGLTNPTFRNRKKKRSENEVRDRALEDKFLDVVDNMPWSEKFSFLSGAVEQMYHGNVNSIFVYGNPETGKSYEVIKKLDELDANYKLYKGNVVKGVDDLFRILYNNREDKILVFDDADKVLTLDPNIWKTVLENKKEREITYVDVRRFRNKNMEDVEPIFTFTSGIIFISNNPKFDDAIASRSLVMNMKLSNDEAIAKVESTLDDFLPDVKMSIKKEALEYAKEISNGVKNMGYRTVETIIMARNISPDNWKKQAIWLISSR